MDVMSGTVVYIVVAAVTIVYMFGKLSSGSLSRQQVRKVYFEGLSKMFQYGQKQIEKKKKKKKKKASHEEAESGSEQRDASRSLIVSEDKQLEKNGNLQDNSTTDSESEDKPRKFQLEDCLDYIRVGVATIIEDDITNIFTVEELPVWNLLSRTNHGYSFISPHLTLLYGLGFILRYSILLPLRFILCFTGLLCLVVSMFLLGPLPQCGIKRHLIRKAFMWSFRLMGGATTFVYFHDTENRPKCNSISVANHTTPIDAQILAIDNLYSLTGQLQGGFIGIIQRGLARASPHIWFDRSETRDRHSVLRLLKEHTDTEHAPPVLMFPEGVCVNNTSVMQFKKGCFEVGCPIYPVAVKYERQYGDAFWYQDDFLVHLADVFSSWALVVHVYYLPPVIIEPGETSIEFAERVKNAIANKAGLTPSPWDGYVKHNLQASRGKFVAKEQETFSKRIC